MPHFVPYLLYEISLMYWALYLNGIGSGTVSVIDLAGFGRHLMMYPQMYSP